jgi:hypothetical protein
MTFKDYYYRKPRSNKLDEGSNRTAVFTFGRLNPPTAGHMKLMQKVHTVANKVGGDPYIFTSQTTDGGLPGKKNKGRNPLDWQTKNDFIRKLVPWANIPNAVEVKNPFQVMGYLGNKGYDNIIFVAGSDRVPEFEKRWLPYARENFKDASVISAGQRDPDAEGAAGMSGTRARQAAKTGDMAKFKVATGWDGNVAGALMNAVRDRLPEDF